MLFILGTQHLYLGVLRLCRGWGMQLAYSSLTSWIWSMNFSWQEDSSKISFALADLLMLHTKGWVVAQFENKSHKFKGVIIHKGSDQFRTIPCCLDGLIHVKGSRGSGFHTENTDSSEYRLPTMLSPRVASRGGSRILIGPDRPSPFPVPCDLAQFTGVSRNNC